MTPLARNQTQAARSLGMSVNTFKERVRPYVKSLTVGRTLLFPESELLRWLDQRAQMP